MHAQIAIVGGGSVGLTLAARLARSGVDVHIVTRRAEAAALLESGLVAEDAATGATSQVDVSASVSIPAGRPILLCTRSDGVPEAIAAIAAAAPTAPVVTFQNDVDNEALAARTIPHVIGGIWRETCTRIGDAHVRFQPAKPSRAVVGLHPEGRDVVVEEIAEVLRRGDIDVGVSERIADDKWLKLCVNLTSAPNALIRRGDHGTAEFSEIKVRLLVEAQRVLGAADIRAASCDGRDRSLPEEIAYHRAAFERGASARPIPLYNQVWSSLTHGTPLEADAYHRRVLELARAHGLDAPTNQRVLEALLAAHAFGEGPEQLSATDLL